MIREKERQTETQTDKQKETDRQRQGQKDRQTDRLVSEGLGLLSEQEALNSPEAYPVVLSSILCHKFGCSTAGTGPSSSVLCW